MNFDDLPTISAEDLQTMQDRTEAQVRAFADVVERMIDDPTYLTGSFADLEAQHRNSLDQSDPHTLSTRDEAPGMTLDELLGDIDTLIEKHDDG